MRRINRYQHIWIFLFIVALFGAFPQFQGKKPKDLTSLQAGNSSSLRDLTDETCGGCHANFHFEKSGDYDLSSGALAHTPGVLGRSRGPGFDPTSMVNGDPLTALIIQKPLEGSVTPHGGIKIPLTHPAIQALMTWVENGAPNAQMDRPAMPAPVYWSGVGGNEHVIVYSRRKVRHRGFRSMGNASDGGNIYRLRFHNDPGTGVNTLLDGGPKNITNLPAEDDAQNPQVSLDGTKVVYSRKRPGQPWQIYEVNTDGTGTSRQITTGPGDKFQPNYLPRMPDGTPARSGQGGIVFLSNAANFLDEYETSTTNSLYVCDANGGNLRQIEFNPSHDAHPWMWTSGVLLFTRWEHNEHQGHNFMPLFQILASDYETAGTHLFGAFGEHNTGPAGNSLHGPSEVYATGHEMLAMAINSNRDDAGGSIAGFMMPKLEGTAASPPAVNIIAAADNDTGRNMGMNTTVSSFTYRSARSLLDNLFMVSRSTLTNTVTTVNDFNGQTRVRRVYGNFELTTWRITMVGGQPKMNGTPTVLLQEDGWNLDEAVPVLVKGNLPKIGKPVDLTQNTGIFTSGDIRERQPDGQLQNINLANVSQVRFVSPLQLSQGRVNTGRKNDQGIATQIVGHAAIMSDGSFAARVPAERPIQFQLLDKAGRSIVRHKPWVQVMRGETMRCVGCHAGHSDAAKIQTLEARQIPAADANTGEIVQFYFRRDIQPMLTEHCVKCHDSALKTGAQGRTMALSLTDRNTPAQRSEAFEMLTGVGGMGGGLVHSQNANASPLMHWLLGYIPNTDPQQAFPNPPATVPHDKMLTPAQIDKIARWIDTGINFRVVDTHDPNNLRALDGALFMSDVWPVIQNKCFSCHSDGGAGANSMNFSVDMDEVDSQEEMDAARMEVAATRVNFMIPTASYLLRKPLGEQTGGMSHGGGSIFESNEDPDYKAIYRWIAASNPSAAPGVPPTDLVSPTNYPNPFRDSTTFVYGLSGAVANEVVLRIYTQAGKLIREINGPTSGGITIGWNKIEWNGEDKNGRKLGNDVGFYTIEAEFGDGTKKRFRGKWVKVK